MARPAAPLTPPERRLALRLRERGTSWREIGRLVGRDHRTVRRYVDGGLVDVGVAAAAALVPAQREPYEPPPVNPYTAALLAVSWHLREHGCCVCGEVAPEPPARPLDVLEHSPCTGLVVAVPGGLGVRS